MNKAKQYYICNACFNKLTTFTEEHAAIVKILDLPDHVTKHPMTPDMSEICGMCDEALAEGYLGLKLEKMKIAIKCFFVLNVSKSW